ncbi:MAG: hypothetical protein J6R29_05645 [Clostridia bacterium]|nr:hypothetical protein [Clostridia bacterium]
MTRREKKELAQQQSSKKKKCKLGVFQIKLISVIAVALMFLVSVGFFIDSFAPANPACYHRWVLSTFHGSYNSKNGPNTYMQFEIAKKTGTSERATSYVWSQVSVTNGAGVKEIWINVSDLYEDEAVIRIRTGKSESNTTVPLKEYKLTKKALKASKDGWIKIYDCGEKGEKGKDKEHTSETNQIFCIGFETQIRLREVGFVGRGGYEAQIKECGTAIEDLVNSATSLTEGAEVKNICDENSTFPYAPKNEEI